jgi:hypothetical protein
MPNTKLPQTAQNVFSQRQNGGFVPPAQQGVGQDKRAFASARHTSRQPAPDKKPLRAPQVKHKRIRSQINFIMHQKAAKVTTWVKPGVKAELERIAAEQGLSVSATSAALLEEAVRQKLHVQHAVLLQPIIEQAIRQQMKGISTKLAWLLVRVAFDAGQTRSLVTNILGRQPGVTPDMLKTILEQSGKSAKGNITRKTPQLTELIEAVEQWILAEGEGYVKND